MHQSVNQAEDEINFVSKVEASITNTGVKGCVSSEILWRICSLTVLSTEVDKETK